MVTLRKGQEGEQILVADGVRKTCPYDRSWCGSDCAQFQINPSYKLENGGEMPATIFLWCCDRRIDIDG